MVGFNLLPGLTFVTAEGVWWLMQHVEGVNKESIAVSLLQVKKSHNYNSCLALDLFLLLNSYKNLTTSLMNFSTGLGSRYRKLTSALYLFIWVLWADFSAIINK